MEQNERCKMRVYGSSFRGYPCERKAWKDGYCKQHHPDSVKARHEKRQAKWQAEFDAKRAARKAAEDAAAKQKALAEVAPVLAEALLKAYDAMREPHGEWQDVKINQALPVARAALHAFEKAKGE